MKKEKVVIAIGGNSINRENEIGTVKEEFHNVRKTLSGVIQIIKNGYDVVLTHGNGPQAGKSLLRVEAGMEKSIPDRPLGLIVADTQGGIGYMIEQSLQNRLKAENIDKEVTTILSQVLVDPKDPSIQNPSKPVGSFYSEAEATILIKERAWLMKEDAKRGWRRVVPSPKPQTIIEKKIISTLVDAGFIVICCGGGGIPVYLNEDGFLEGIDCIIDKDFASAVLATEIQAKTLILVTGVEKVAINFREENQKDLDEMTLADCRRYINEKQFPAGSMLPKIEAAIKFVEQGGEEAIITLPETMVDALEGKTGTRIIK